MDENFNKLAKQVSDKFDADVLLYRSRINYQNAVKLFEITKETTRPNVFLVLSTLGGDPHAAFKIARRLQVKYKKFYLYVYGLCKSAGTLIAVGAHELIMSDFAELGPLDMQLPEKDELAKISSGLNVDEALRSLKSETYSFFNMILNEGINAGLSTKMAAELASNLAIKFINPIAAQIDPLRVGATRRAVKIALAYGERLLERAKNLKSYNALVELVQIYPDHRFVIDYLEASSLFKVIRKNNLDEENLAEILYYGDFLEEEDTICKFNILGKKHEADNLPATVANA